MQYFITTYSMIIIMETGFGLTPICTLKENRTPITRMKILCTYHYTMRANWRRFNTFNNVIWTITLNTFGTPPKSYILINCIITFTSNNAMDEIYCKMTNYKFSIRINSQHFGTHPESY